MKHIAAIFLCVLPIGALALQPAEAQVTVYDPANHAENILQAARALQELDNQVRQLAHEIDMIEKMARNLETLPINVAQAIIQDRVTRVGELIREAEGIGYSVEEAERSYGDLYPETYGEIPPPAPVLVEEARARWEQSRLAHKHVLRMTAEISRTNRQDGDALAGLVGESQAAVGQLQATQAGNQIQALTAGQLMQIETLLAAHHRALSLDEARRLAEAERGRARLKSFLGE